MNSDRRTQPTERQQQPLPPQHEPVREREVIVTGGGGRSGIDVNIDNPANENPADQEPADDSGS